MHIKSIKLKNFKKFSQEEGYEVRFPADLTVVRAPNESGKSTVVSAITAGLFLSPKSAKSKAFQSWQSGNLPKIIIVFEENGETFELLKDFDVKESTLTNIDSGEKMDNLEEINNKINEIFGFSDESIFTGVFSVDQNAFFKLDEHKTTLQESLENLVTGSGTRTVSEIISSLEKEISAITKQSLKNPGHLQRIKGELSKTEEVLAGFDSKMLRLNNLSSEFSEKSAEFEKVEKSFNSKKQILQFSKEINGYKKDLDRVDGNLEKLESAGKELQDINKKLENFEEFKNVDVEKLRDKIRELVRKVNFKKWSEENLLSKIIRTNYKLMIFLFASLAIVFGAMSFVFAYSLIASLVFVVLAGLVAYFHSKISKTYQLRLASKDLGVILKKFNARSEEDLYQKINDVSKLFFERGKLMHSFAILGGENAFLKQKDERKRLLRVSDAVQIRAQELEVEIIEDEQELKHLLREVEVLDKNKTDLVESIGKIQGELKGLNFSEEDKIRMEEMEQSLSEQLEYWEKKLKILEKTKELMETSREKTLLGLKDRLADYVSEFLSVISGGKYKKISIDQDFSFKVFSDEKESEIVPEDDLSRGAIDQFYLTIRFAFAKILTRNKKSFIVLDDPFHNFDESRKQNTKRLLQDLAGEFQIILFTHSDEYDDWGEVVKID